MREMNSSSKPDENQPKKKPTLATNEEKEQPDFISALPDEILLIILSKLQIRDAAVTTAVSKRWAPLFSTLPSLEIDANFLAELWDKDEIEWFHALFAVLDSRRTSIKKFLLALPRLDDHENYYNKAVCDVCAAGVEELSIIELGDIGYQIPPSVFACDTITKLEIACCVLVVPSKLTGLQSVKSLNLRKVEVADNDLQRMISQCKAMEKLVIIDCREVENIVICAPNLSQLVIDLYGPVGIVLKSVPQLASVSVSFIDEELNGRVFEIFKAANLSSFLNGLQGVKDLRLDFNWSCGESMDDTLLPSYKYCPEARKLIFWEKELPAECVKHHLTTATFYLDKYISQDCFVFPKFLLLNAGNLKSMNMLFYNRERETTSKTEEKIKNEILATQMASPDVEIIIKSVNWHRYTKF